MAKSKNPNPKREFCLVSVTNKKIVLRGGKPVTVLAKQPPRGERFSQKYRGAGYDFAVVEIAHDHRHVGEPVYDWPDLQKAVIRKTLAPPR
jgi:hypothetical protein